MKSPFSPLKKYAAAGLLAYAACWSTLASAQSQPTTVVDGIAADFYADYAVGDVEWRGPAFTTGAVPTKITEITFGLKNIDPTAQATLRLFQLDDTTELPSGEALGSASLPIVNADDDTNLSANTYTAAQLGSIPGITLLAHKKYALILSSPSGSAISLSDNNGPGNAYTYSGGFSTAAQGYLQTPDSGANWLKNGSVTPAVRMTVMPIEVPIDVVPPPPPTPVPTMGVLGLLSLASIMGLVGLRRMRKSA